MGWLTSFFMNPAFVPVGAMLVASPIIIHLINRMRFRKVRFAAMEFLLQAQQRNRRRLLLEQLLLLLLRILIVLAILALIARLILDPRLTVFGGEGRAHHLVLLDDSASMQNRWGDTNAFKEAKEVIRKLVREGANRPQTQKFSMVLLSEPNKFFIAERDVDSSLVRDVEEKLETLEPTFKRPDLQTALELAGQNLRKDKAVIKHLHVLSDFRQEDWQGKEPLGEVISSLDEDGISVNLIRTVDQSLPNLGLTTLEGDLHAVAVGVPVRLTIGVTNFGDQVVENVRATVVVDGEKLPLSITFPKIEAGEEDRKPQDITFSSEGLHRVRVELEDDSLSADNVRYLSIDMPLRNNVLIVTGDVNSLAAEALKLALAPDPALTGISPVIVSPDFLRRETLTRFRSIYCVNVPDVPPDALPQLQAYVRDGGGLVWFMGDNVKIDFYNDVLSGLDLNEEGVPVRVRESLFPVLLANSHVPLSHDDPTITTPDLNFVPHPIFNDTFRSNNPLIRHVVLEAYLPVISNWITDDNKRADETKTAGYARGGNPIVFDHRFGKGRVVTFLTSAGPPWTNLIESNVLVYLPLIQELQKYVAKPDPIERSREIGQAIELDFPALDYDDQVYFLVPGMESSGASPSYTMTRRKAEDDGKAADDQTAAAATPEPPAGEESPDKRPANTDRLHAIYRNTDQPGIYSYEVKPLIEGLPTKGAFAYNVSPKEGDVKLASDEEIREHLSPEARVEIRKLGDTSYISEGQDPGQEVRNYLMYSLLFLLVAEQAMAYRLSYHPNPAEAAA